MLGAPALMHFSAEARISSTVIGWLGLARLLKKAPVMVVEIITVAGMFHFGIGSTSAKRLGKGGMTPRLPSGLPGGLCPAPPLPPRPRRAEQDSIGLPMDVTPQRDAKRRISACYCAPSRSHPVNGSLLHAPAHLSRPSGGGGGPSPRLRGGG